MSDDGNSVRGKADPSNPDDWGSFGRARRRTNAIANVGLTLLASMAVTYALCRLWPDSIVLRVYQASMICLVPMLIIWLGSVHARNQMRCPWCTLDFYPRDFTRALFTQTCPHCRVTLPRGLR